MTAHALKTAFLEYAIPFHSRSSEPADFSDLEGLRPVLARRRVVLLGEHSHGDGAAFAVKSRLIRFLHRVLGFDVMAFEAGIYDCLAAWQTIQASPGDRAAVRAAFRGALPDIWSRCAQVAPLMDDIAAQAAGPRPLELGVSIASSATWLGNALRRSRPRDCLLRGLLGARVGGHAAGCAGTDRR